MPAKCQICARHWERSPSLGEETDTSTVRIQSGGTEGWLCPRGWEGIRAVTVCDLRGVSMHGVPRARVLYSWHINTCAYEKTMLLLQSLARGLVEQRAAWRPGQTQKRRKWSWIKHCAFSLFLEHANTAPPKEEHLAGILRMSKQLRWNPWLSQLCWPLGAPSAIVWKWRHCHRNREAVLESESRFGVTDAHSNEDSTGVYHAESCEGQRPLTGAERAGWWERIRSGGGQTWIQSSSISGKVWGAKICASWYNLIS